MNMTILFSKWAGVKIRRIRASWKSLSFSALSTANAFEHAPAPVVLATNEPPAPGSSLNLYRKTNLDALVFLGPHIATGINVACIFF